MGGLNSYLIGCCGSSNNCPENHCKLKLIHSSRSFTFNKINDNENPLESSLNEDGTYISSDAVNINNASEDVLMTLPGINRKIAHDIIVHRNKIGKFKKIEDLALVNGIGAVKFKLIKPDISIGSSSDNEMKEIFMNEFNIFQLTKIPGFSQTLAERIVHYREKKGPFTCWKEFLKVPGMSKKLLDSIKPFIKLKVCNGAKSETVNQIEEISVHRNRHQTDESFINFTAGLRSAFNFFLGAWKMENGVIETAKDVNELLAFSEEKPTTIILICPESIINSTETTRNKLNDKFGVNHFDFVKCGVGDNCLHNNYKTKLSILSNFHHFSKSVSLNSLSEDVLNCLIFTIETAANHNLCCVAIFRCLVTYPINETEESTILHDIAAKLNSDGVNTFVFLCDSFLMKLAHIAFLNNGFNFHKELDSDYAENVLSIIQVWRECETAPNLQIQIKQVTSQLTNSPIQNNFDILVPLC